MNRGRLGLRGPRTSVGTAVVSGEDIADLSAEVSADLSAHINADLSAHVIADLSAEAARLDFCGVNDGKGCVSTCFAGRCLLRRSTKAFPSLHFRSSAECAV